MAYQTPGTPVFYVDLLSFIEANGIMPSFTHPIFSRRNPSLGSFGSTIHLNASGNEEIPYNCDIPSKLLQDNCFVAYLGHNLAVHGLNVEVKTISTDSDGNQTGDYGSSRKNVCNWKFYPTPVSHNGFSMWTFNVPAYDNNINQIIMRYHHSALASQSLNIKHCAFIMGTYYTLPHSPELKLTMTREMDGVKRSRTRGGYDLVKHQYISPPKWGNAAPWELYDVTTSEYQRLSRIGRRVWSLSFNSLQESAIFPKVSNLDWFDTSYTSSNIAGKTILDHNSFYSQVIHKTSPNLPFVFQPDSNNNNPDSFAICKFDQSSFQFKQVANGVYDAKLKIREVW